MQPVLILISALTLIASTGLHAETPSTRPAVVRPGDTLQVVVIEARVVQSVPTVHKLTVDADGKVDIPDLGPTQVAEKTPASLESPLGNALKKARKMQLPVVAVTILPDLKESPVVKTADTVSVTLTDRDKSYMSLTASSAVDDKGLIALKTIGTYPARDLTVIELETLITRCATINFNIKRPKVAVTLNPPAAKP